MYFITLLKHKTKVKRLVNVITLNKYFNIQMSKKVIENYLIKNNMLHSRFCIETIQ